MILPAGDTSELRWTPPDRKKALVARARTEGDWLALEQVRPRRQTARSPRRLLHLLSGNDRLSGGARIVLGPDRRFRVRAEALSPGPGGREQCLERMFADLRVVAEAFPALLRGKAPEPSPAGDAGGEQALVEAAEEAGWPATRRPDGSAVFPLDRAGCSAETEHSAAAGWKLVCTLADLAEAGDTGLRATAVFLLSLTDSVRLVRAGMRRGERSRSVRLQVHLPAEPSAAETGAALSALSVAVRLARAETRALLDDEALSLRYLNVRGWSAEPPRKAPEPDPNGEKR